MKTIKPLFQSISKRRKLIGFEVYYDGALIGVYGTRPEAQHILDQIAFEILRAA
jgi:hypothetical protein